MNTLVFEKYTSNHKSSWLELLAFKWDGMNDSEVKEKFEWRYEQNPCTSIHSFAYPNGKPGFDFGEREIDILKKNGIKLAFSTVAKTLKEDDDLFSIPRSGFEGGSMPYIYLKLLSDGNLERVKKFLNKKDETSYRYEFDVNCNIK